MNPEEPESAHSIVAEYARLLEANEPQAFPAPVRQLPYPKQTIKAAVLTCASTLANTGQLNDDMRAFLEEAYVALADYVEDDLVRVMSEYRHSLAAVADIHSTRDRIATPEWQRIAETSRLAGDIARSIAEDAARLRLEFRSQVNAHAM
jgi:hypothetical protein